METKTINGKAIRSPQGIRREDLPANCVTRDYDIFNDKIEKDENS
jgi:hypothetical protein